MPNPTPVTEKPPLFHSDSTLIDVQPRRRRPPALNLSDGNSSETLERPFLLSQDERHRTSPTIDASVSVAEEAETDQEIESEDDEVEEEKKVNVDLKAHKKQEEISHFTPLRLFCYHFFYKVSTKRALWFMYFSMFCVIVSVVLVCLQSLNAFSLDTGGSSSRAVYHRVWLPIEIVLTIIFTIEYLGSLYGAPNRWKFCKKWLNILDLISILPFYINFIFPSENGGVIRILRGFKIIRILQLFKVVKLSPALQIASRALYHSVDALVMLLVYGFLCTLITATAIYYAERGEYDPSTDTWLRNNVLSPFQSIPDGFYWAVTTLTTTGYGDVTPVTTAGRIVAAVAMMAGVTMIALPVSIIGTNFMNEWMNHQRVQLQKKMEERRRDFDDLLGSKDAETASRGSKGKIGRSKGATIKILREERDLISQVVLEVQDRLADINPPKYYSRYKEMQRQYYAACEKIKELEAEVQELRKLAKPLIDPYVASPATSPLSARFLLKPSARNTLQAFKIAHHTHHISHPIGRSLTNPVEPSIPRLHQTSPSGRGGRTSNVHRIRNKLRSLINKQDNEGALKTSEISVVPGSLAPMFTSMPKQHADSQGVLYGKREIEESGSQKDARTTVTNVPTISVELPSPTEPDIPEESDEVEASVMSLPCTGKEIEWVREARKMLKKSQLPENTDPARPTRSLHDLFQQPRNDTTSNSTSTSLPHQLDPSRSSVSNQHSHDRRNSLDDILDFAGTVKPPPPDSVIISLDD